MLLAVVMAFACLPMVQAEDGGGTIDGVSYIDENGDAQTADGVTVVDSDSIDAMASGSTITFGSGWYLFRGDISKTATSFEVASAADVKFILEDGSKFESSYGSNGAHAFTLLANSALTIYAQSDVFADGSNAGEFSITGSSKYDATNYQVFYIYGTATLNIYGGTLRAIGKSPAGSAAITGGSAINIVNSVVEAAGASAGQGDTHTAHGISAGHLTIKNSHVTATGAHGNSSTANGATAGYGIVVSSGNLTVENSTVIATGGYATRAGSTRDGIYVGLTTTITNSNITATGGDKKYGSNTGAASSGILLKGNTTITGSTITAKGGAIVETENTTSATSGAHGIRLDPTSTATLTINTSDITVIGGAGSTDAAGGHGMYLQSGSTVNIDVTGGELIAKGAGDGKAFKDTVPTITGTYAAWRTSETAKLTKFSAAAFPGANTTDTYVQLTQTPPVYYGDFAVSGGTYGTDYEYDDDTSTLTFIKAGDFEVSMKETLDNPSSAHEGYTKDKILVEATGYDDITITLVDVKIDATGDTTAPAFQYDKARRLDLLLDGENYLLSSEDFAGLNITAAASQGLYIDSKNDPGNEDGYLYAASSGSGAGIGSNKEQTTYGGTIYLNGGTIEAYSNPNGEGKGAGIGGGEGKGGATIYIQNHVVVTAMSSKDGDGYGAGIGAGFGASKLDLEVSGGTVFAASSTAAAGKLGDGIGIGQNGDRNDNGTGTQHVGIKINYTNKVAAKLTATGARGLSAAPTLTQVQSWANSASLNYVSNIANTGTEFKYRAEDGSIADGLFDYVVFKNPATLTGDFVVTGGTLGTDYTFADGKLTILGDGEYTISMADPIDSESEPGSGATTNQIIVDGDATPTIILDNVHIDRSGLGGTSNTESALSIGVGAEVKLLLKGENSFISNAQSAGIYVPYQGSGVYGALTIDSYNAPGTAEGKLYAASGGLGAGIGGNGGFEGDGNSVMGAGEIKIDGGIIEAYSSANPEVIGYGAGIGGGGSKTTSVTTAGLLTKAAINGGFVTARATKGASGSNEGAAGIGGGANVASITNSSAVVAIDLGGKADARVLVTGRIAFNTSPSIAGSFGWRISQSNDYTAGSFNPAQNATEAYVDLIGAYTGDFVITGGVQGTNFKYEKNVLTFITNGDFHVTLKDGITQTSHGIAVNTGKTVTLTLEDVDIDASATTVTAPAIDLLGTANVKLVLVGANSLQSGSGKAGIRMIDTSTIDIGGTGSLNVIAGFDAPAIGTVADAGKGGATITISGGDISLSSTTKVTVSVGRGSENAGGTINITGGNVYATASSIGLSGLGMNSDTVNVDFSGATSDKPARLIIEGSNGGFGPTPTITGVDAWRKADTDDFSPNSDDTAYNDDDLADGKAKYLEFVSPLKRYTITFDANGGVCDTATMQTGFDGKLASLPTPTREGYTFEGWSYIVKGTTSATVSTSTVFTEDKTAKAVWNINPDGEDETYTITFDASGEVWATMLTNSSGKLDALPEEPTAADGYIFDCWKDMANIDVPVTTDTVFTKDTTLYAIWEEVPEGTFVITLDPGEGVVTPTSVTTDTDGKITTLPTPTRGGYTFSKWQDEDGNAYAVGDTLTADITLYAVWTQNQQPNPPTPPTTPTTPTPSITVSAKPEEGAPTTGISTPVNEIADKIFTPEELERIASGESAEVFITVEDISHLVSDEDKAATQSLLEADGEIALGLYIDISLFKQVGDDVTQMHETNGKIQLQIEIPEELRASGRSFKIVRVHEGVAEIIEGIYDEETGIFTFETDRFSTYAIVYSVEEEEEEETEDEPEEEDTDEVSDGGDEAEADTPAPETNESATDTTGADSEGNPQTGASLLYSFAAATTAAGAGLLLRRKERKTK